MESKVIRETWEGYLKIMPFLLEIQKQAICKEVTIQEEVHDSEYFTIKLKYARSNMKFESELRYDYTDSANDIEKYFDRIHADLIGINEKAKEVLL